MHRSNIPGAPSHLASPSTGDGAPSPLERHSATEGSASSGGSILVWAQVSPAASVQAEWTAALARGLGRDVTLVDVIDTPLSMSLVHARQDLREEIKNRRDDLVQLAQGKFHEVDSDVQVQFSRSAESEFIETAVAEPRDPIVLWAPVRERLIRKLLKRAGGKVIVVRSSDHATQLPWVGVEDEDQPALSVAQALINGADRELSVRLLPSIDPEDTTELSCGIACVSRPVPGWWRSHLLRRRRGAVDSPVPVVEVYGTKMSS